MPQTSSIFQRQKFIVTKFIVTSLDESFNKVISKGQIDVLFRIWNTAENRVSTRYVNSVLMGKATAPDVLENFEAVSIGLNKNKFIQLSSDGRNVNSKFLELGEKCKDDGFNELISIGTCSLHTVNKSISQCRKFNCLEYKKIIMWEA